MEYYLSKHGTIPELKEGIQQVLENLKTKSILILSCDENKVDRSEISELLKHYSTPIFGGIYPGIILENQKLSEGTLIVGLPFNAQIQLIKNVSSPDIDFEKEVAKLHENDFEFKTLTVIVDGFSKRISALIEALFIVFGLEYSYIGGGAGSLSMVQKPCVISNEGVLEDCALIVGTDAECGLGVHHGWESIAGPFKITSAHENTIHSIDFKPAFEVYKAIIHEHSGKELKEENFFNIAKSYPFGINKLGAEKVVRDPITVKNDSLICVGEVKEGAFIDVLHGNKISLTKAAAMAAKDSQENELKEKPDFCVFIDCISRVLFLGDDFIHELNAVKSADTLLFGTLSIGEIANNKKDYLEFYNKTAVVASFKTPT